MSEQEMTALEAYVNGLNGESFSVKTIQDSGVLGDLSRRSIRRRLKKAENLGRIQKISRIKNWNFYSAVSVGSAVSADEIVVSLNGLRESTISIEDIPEIIPNIKFGAVLRQFINILPKRVEPVSEIYERVSRSNIGESIKTAVNHIITRQTTDRDSEFQSLRGVGRPLWVLNLGFRIKGNQSRLSREEIEGSSSPSELWLLAFEQETEGNQREFLQVYLDMMFQIEHGRDLSIPLQWHCKVLWKYVNDYLIRDDRRADFLKPETIVKASRFRNDFERRQGVLVSKIAERAVEDEQEAFHRRRRRDRASLTQAV